MSRTYQSAPVGTPPSQTPADARLSDAYTPILRRVAADNELRVHVGRTTRGIAGIERRTGQPVQAPGAWWPAESLIELDASILGSSFNFEGINPAKFSDLAAIAPLHGIALHNAAHAAHTVWDYEALASLPNAVRETVALFEDIRVEAVLLKRRPYDAKWLRAAARIMLRYELLNDDQMLWSAAKIALLTGGRVAAGSLEPADIDASNTVLTSILGAELLGELEGMWQRVVLIDDAHQWKLVQIAEQWCDTLGVAHDDELDGADALEVVSDDDSEGDPSDGEGQDGEDTSENPGGQSQPGSSSGAGGQSEPSDGDDDSSGSEEGDEQAGDAHSELDDSDTDDSDDTSDAGDSEEPSEAGEGEQDADDLRDQLRKALDEIGANTETGARKDLDEEAEIADAVEEADEAVDESRKRQAARKSAESAQRRADEKLADEMFDDSDDDSDPEHSEGSSGHRPAVSGWRQPTGSERASAAILARELERDLWRPPSTFSQRTSVPPGRLNTRGAVAQSAQIALGKPVTAKPWKQTRRIPEPPLELVVGLALDRSGSMSSLVGPTCSAGWVVANAMSRIGGKFAAVTFGEECEPLTPKQRPPTKVPVLKADAGYESIGTAIRVLDGALGLSVDGAIRVLCIISDGYWVNETERRLAETQLAKLARAGCAVLLCNAGPVEDVRNTRKVELTGAGELGRMLAGEIRKALATA